MMMALQVVLAPAFKGLVGREGQSQIRNSKPARVANVPHQHYPIRNEVRRHDFDRVAAPQKLDSANFSAYEVHEVPMPVLLYPPIDII